MKAQFTTNIFSALNLKSHKSLQRWFPIPTNYFNSLQPTYLQPQGSCHTQFPLKPIASLLSALINTLQLWQQLLKKLKTMKSCKKSIMCPTVFPEDTAVTIGQTILICTPVYLEETQRSIMVVADTLQSAMNYSVYPPVTYIPPSKEDHLWSYQGKTQMSCMREC